MTRKNEGVKEPKYAYRLSIGSSIHRILRIREFAISSSPAFIRFQHFPFSLLFTFILLIGFLRRPKVAREDETDIRTSITNFPLFNPETDKSTQKFPLKGVIY